MQHKGAHTHDDDGSPSVWSRDAKAFPRPGIGGLLLNDRFAHQVRVLLSNHLQFPCSPQRYGAHHPSLQHQQRHPPGSREAYHQQQTTTISPKGRHGAAVMGLSTTTLGIERESTRNSLASSRLGGEQSDG